MRQKLSNYEFCCRILQETAMHSKHRPIEDILPCLFWEKYNELTEKENNDLDDFMVYVNQLRETQCLKKAG